MPQFERSIRKLRRGWLTPGLIAGCVLLAAVQACSDDGTGIDQPPRISIVPEEPVALYIGDTVTVRATVRNMAHVGVSYSSSAPETVTVDELSGLVTALAPGEATVTGVSVIDPRVFAEVDVTVLPDLPASVAISALIAADGSEVDTGAASGTVLTRLDLIPGNARLLEVRLGEAIVCEQAYSPPIDELPGGTHSVECTIDTAAYDEQDGVPLFTNGATAIRARLVASAGRTLVEAAERPLTLRNVSRVAALVTSSRSAVDAAGESWISGDVSVQAVPVLYDPDQSVSAVTLSYQSPAGADTAITDQDAPYHFTLAADGILAGVTDPAFRAALSSADAEGAEGPAGSTPELRYDGAPPVPGALIARDWVGAQTRFIDTYSTEGESDDGVGRIHLKFFAGDAALSAEAIVAGGTSVVDGGDLSQAARGTYRLVARVCDGLDNCVLEDGYLFGVDLTAPIVESVSIPDLSANPGADMSIGVRDDLSGFPERLLEVAVRLLDATPATPSCGPAVESVDLPGKPQGTTCAPDTVANPVPVPRTTAGYYSYELVAFDRAGNRSAPVKRSLLVDLEAPNIGPLTLPASLVPGESMEVVASVDDDVELLEAEVKIVFPSPTGGAGIALPFGPAQPIGEPFDEALATEATATVALPFVRTLTLGDASAGARPTLLVDSVRATARDAARLTASSGWWAAPAAYGGDTSTLDPYHRFATALVTVDRTAVCTGGCTTGDPTTVRMSARIEGESGTGRPFAHIHFYRLDAAGSFTHVGTVAGEDATITNAGNRSTYLYALDHPSAPQLSGEFGIVAVGVNSRGNALATPLAAAPGVTFYRR